MKLLTSKIQNGAALLNKRTWNQLKQKHPQDKETDFNTLLADTPKEINPINLDGIDAELLKAGRSQIDTDS